MDTNKTLIDANEMVSIPARTPEGKRVILVILDLEQDVQHHGAAAATAQKHHGLDTATSQHNAKCAKLLASLLLVQCSALKRHEVLSTHACRDTTDLLMSTL